MNNLLSTTMLAAALITAASAANAASLTILHNNDGESQLIDAGGVGSEFGGSARFVSIVNFVRDDREGQNRDVLTLSSGDNFLPGPEFNASLSDGVFYDAQVLNAVNYDALALGNHDFDFGPDLLADFIGEVDNDIQFVSANLDFSANAGLQQLVDDGRIVKSTVIDRGGEQYGIVGATTEELPIISQPGDVAVGDVVSAVQAEIDALTGNGVDKIILISHLQGIAEDIDVVGQLTGVDVAIAGGGDELLTNSADALNPNALVPGDDDERFGPYPLVVDVAGNGVPVVTTQGDYRYLGVLDIEFDDDGNLTDINTTSDVQLISQAFLDDNGLVPDATIQANVVDPVSEAIAGFAANIVAQSEVELDGVRGNVRTEQTNLGALIADSFVWTAEQQDTELGGILNGNPVVGIANGGGIRNDAIIDIGDITELDTFSILPFSNFVSVINDLPVEALLATLERAVSNVEGVSGRFGQVSGIEFSYNPEREAGNRILDVFLADGTPIILNGFILDEDLLIDLVTVNFLANGGDGYPLAEFDQTNLPISYQQSLLNYITSQDGLGGVIPESLYSDDVTSSRIAAISEPMTLALFGAGLTGLGLYRRRS
ncbi:MAG: 5'-nucleotidase C-terminal domain-containing protein [Pseudomonadota bacterium]